MELDELRDGSHHLDGYLYHVLGRRHGSCLLPAPAAPQFRVTAAATASRWALRPCCRHFPALFRAPFRAGPSLSPELTRARWDPPPRRVPGSTLREQRKAGQHRSLWKVFLFIHLREEHCTNITGNFLAKRKKSIKIIFIYEKFSTFFSLGILFPRVVLTQMLGKEGKGQARSSSYTKATEPS